MLPATMTAYDKISLSELAALPLIAPAGGTIARERWDQVFAAAGAEPHVRSTPRTPSTSPLASSDRELALHW